MWKWKICVRFFALWRLLLVTYYFLTFYFEVLIKKVQSPRVSSFGIRVPGLEVPYPAPWGLGSSVLDLGSWVLGPKSWVRRPVPGPGFLVLVTGSWVFILDYAQSKVALQKIKFVLYICCIFSENLFIRAPMEGYLGPEVFFKNSRF